MVSNFQKKLFKDPRGKNKFASGVVINWYSETGKEVSSGDVKTFLDAALRNLITSKKIG